MQIELAQQERFTILSLEGRLDGLNAPAFEQKVKELLDDGKQFVILDMSRVVFVSSAGLRGILLLAKGLRAIQGEVRFAGLQPVVAEVFEISGFTSLFPLYINLEEALSAV